MRSHSRGGGRPETHVGRDGGRKPGRPSPSRGRPAERAHLRALLAAGKILFVDQKLLHWGGGQLLLPPDLSVPPHVLAVTTGMTEVSGCGANAGKVNSKWHSSLATQTWSLPPGTSEAQTSKSDVCRSRTRLPWEAGDVSQASLRPPHLHGEAAGVRLGTTGSQARVTGPPLCPDLHRHHRHRLTSAALRGRASGAARSADSRD